jgi:two-component system sensor kinase FixL
MDMSRALSIYAPANRQKFLAFATLMIIAIAIIDWRVPSYISLGFLYLFPIMLASGYLTKTQIALVALACTALQELFSNLPGSEAIPRLVMTSIGFVGTGFFISELMRNRRIVLSHLEQVEEHIKLREDAEEQIRRLVESSPAAILTIDSAGMIVLANSAALDLLAPLNGRLEGQAILGYLPSLLKAVQVQPTRALRTTLQCKGQRGNGEVFLAGVWFSTYKTASGAWLAAIIVDLSEDLRNREDLSLDHLLKNTRILMSAVSHEIRNLCGAALAVHRNLSSVKALDGNEDFHALGTLIQGLEKLSAMELASGRGAEGSVVDLTILLEEFRVLIETAYRESNIHVNWQVDEHLPLVWADRYGLVQAFLNLARNSQRAMQSTAEKTLTVTTSVQGDLAVVRFDDTGTGIADPANLFRPFSRNAEATGLGLYVSRAILKSFGGDITFEPRPRGCCFAIMLHSIPAREGVVHE